MTGSRRLKLRKTSPPALEFLGVTLKPSLAPNEPNVVIPALPIERFSHAWLMDNWEDVSTNDAAIGCKFGRLGERAVLPVLVVAPK